MKKIAIAAAAIMTLTGAALAENPYVGGRDINDHRQTQVDTTRTFSIGQASSAYTVGGDVAGQNDAAIEYRQSHFGNR
jgi:hypothetical protein